MMFHICAPEETGLLTFRAFFRTISLDGGGGGCYYRGMNTPEDTSDLPDNFDPTWQEDEEIDWEYEKYLDCQIDASWDY